MNAATWVGVVAIAFVLAFDLVAWRRRRMDERMRAEEAKERYWRMTREKMIEKIKANWHKAQPHDAGSGEIVSAEFAVDNPNKVVFIPATDPAKIERFEDEYITNVVKLARRFRDSGWSQVEGFELTVFAVNGGCSA